MNSVAIVVLNWNRMADTLSCIDSLHQQTYKNYKIILIDNGSTERGTKSSLDMLENTYSDSIVIIRNSKNNGFAGGVNIGIRYAHEQDYQYVALLNNDATVEKKWLKELVMAAEAKNSAITTSLILTADGSKIDSTGDWYTAWGLPYPRNRGDTRKAAPKAGFVFGASGGASLYRSSLFKDIGLFDESFFAYYEDVDMSFRAQLRGYRTYYTNKAIVYHNQGASTTHLPGFAIYQTFKNLPLLYVKNVPSELAFSIGLRFFIAYHLMLAKALLGKRAVYALKGWGKAIILTPQKIVERRGIQKNRGSDAEYMKKIICDDLPPDQTGLRRIFR